MKIGQDAPDRSVAQDAADGEEKGFEIGLQRSLVLDLRDPEPTCARRSLAMVDFDDQRR